MNWILLVVYFSYGQIGGMITLNGGNNMVDGIYGTREECQTALEAYAKKSSAAELTLVCVQGESFKPVATRVHPKTE